MKTFKDLKCFDKFTIAEEQGSIFYKECNLYNGGVNAYRILKNGKDKVFDIAIFGANNIVTIVEENK